MMKWIVAAALLAAPLVRAEEEPEKDDPRGRIAAQRLLQGDRTPEQQLELLRTAESEAARYGLSKGGFDAPVAAAGAAWVNIGPTTADFEKNGSKYFKVDSGRARRILVDPRDANIVYFATSGGGVWKTYNALSSPAKWTPITETIGSLSVGSVALNPANPDAVLLGLGDPFDVHVPGVLTSPDGGATWSSAAALSGTYNGSTVFTATSVREFSFDPAGALVFAATDAGLFRSQEGGVGTGWTLMKPNGTTPQSCWSVVYAGANTFVAACIDSITDAGAIYRTTDQGATWSQRSLGTTDVRRMTLASAQIPSTTNWKVYVLAANANEDDQRDVFVSTDSGANYAGLNMQPGGRAPTNPTANGSDVDQDDLDFMHGQAFYNQMIVVDPANPNNVFVGGNLCMGRSTDGGTTWTLLTDWLPFTGRFSGFDMTDYAHADWHAGTLARFGNNTYFYGGNDGGLIRATDDGSTGVLHSGPSSLTWDDTVNKGIAAHLIYSVATGNERVSNATCTAGNGAQDIVYGGFQDNGTRIRVPSSGATPYVGFNQIIGGDGFGVGLGCNATGGGIGSNLISTYASQLSTSDDGLSTEPTFTRRVTSNGTGLNPAISLHGGYTFVMRVVADLAATAGLTYILPLTDTATAGHMYKSTDGGHSWNRINGTIHRASGNVTSFALPVTNAASHPKASGVYAAVMLSRVYVTADGGTNWFESPKMASSSSSDFLQLYTAGFDSSDTTGNTVWVGSKSASLSGGAAIPAGTGHLFKCTNMLTAGSCTAMSSGIPASVPVNVVKTDPNDGNTIYVGSEIGLYRSTNGGTSFSRYGNNLPLVSVTDIAVANDGSSVRIATWGRGFWEIYPKAGGSPAGVAGNGDFDTNGAVDGYDLVREAGLIGLDSSSDSYNGIGNLTGSTNSIDTSDFSALVTKFGGRP